MDNEVCEYLHVHESAVARVREVMPDITELMDLAELYKVFADTTRVRILYLLTEGELCVCDISKLLDMNQSAISHQLRILKHNKLVRSRREGKTVFYSLADSHVEKILNNGMEHVRE